MNYQEILDRGSKILKLNKIKNPHLDCELILSKVLNKNREEILINLNNKVDLKIQKKFNYYLDIRKKNKPIAYILGSKYFWKYKFYINNSVLIPRPETEHIIEESLKLLPLNKSANILDIGTGSGCIIISLIKERQKCLATAIDISKEAINMAKINAKLHHIGNKIKFLNINIDKYKSSKYDLIISNPPYISDIELKRLDDDVKLYEPKLALSGGITGFKEIENTIKKSSELLKYNGKLIIEIGERQKNFAKKILEKNGFYIKKICKDFSGKDRCIVNIKIKK